MVYLGHVENGVIVLEEHAPLPEGTRVQVQPVQQGNEYDSLREGLLKFAGRIEGLPPDMAAQHDHYIHGTRKR